MSFIPSLLVTVASLLKLTFWLRKYLTWFILVGIYLLPAHTLCTYPSLIENVVQKKLFFSLFHVLVDSNHSAPLFSAFQLKLPFTLLHVLDKNYSPPLFYTLQLKLLFFLLHFLGSEHSTSFFDKLQRKFLLFFFLFTLAAMTRGFGHIIFFDWHRLYSLLFL